MPGPLDSIVHQRGTEGPETAQWQTRNIARDHPASVLPSDYGEVLADLKERIRSAHVRAHRDVNRGLIELYWSIGKTILERQADAGWGAKVIEVLAADLRREFPDMKGLSRRNLYYMRDLASGWPQIVQQPAALLPWGHLMVLLDKVDDQDERDWYALEAVRHGWTRDVLRNQIKGQLHRRVGAAPSNFEVTVPDGESELVQQMVKDPYNFEFLGLGDAHSERELETSLVARIRDFLLEMGHGFAFVGRQFHIEVDGDDFFIDLLLYNIPLHRYVVVELKIGKFTPAEAGQLNTYVNMVDGEVRSKGDNPTVGILLCADRNERVVKYALGGTTTPMAVARYEALPVEVQDAIPVAAEFEGVIEQAAEYARLTLSEYLADLEEQTPD